MTTWYPGTDWSPNRMDALAWAAFAVMPELGAKEPRRKVKLTW